MRELSTTLRRLSAAKARVGRDIIRSAAQGRYRLARELAVSAFKSNPPDIDLRFSKAQTDATLGNNESALEGFREILLLQPSHMASRVALANMLAATRDYVSAISELDVVLGVDAKHLQARLMKGQIQAAMRDYDGAIDTFKQVLVDDPSVDVAIDSLTQIYLGLNRHSDVVANLKAAIAHGLGTEKRVRYLANAMAADAEFTVASLRPTDPGGIEFSTDAPAEDIANGIQGNTYALVRQIYDQKAKEFFWKAALENFVNADGVQPYYMQSLYHCRKIGETKDVWVYETDIALLLHALNPRVMAIAESYFKNLMNETAFVVLYHSVNCRYYQPTTLATAPETMLPFHQDGIGFPRTYKVLNFWTLLYPDECGTTSPGLDFGSAAPDVFLSIAEEKGGGDYDFLKTKSSFMDAILRKFPLFTPSITQGDAMIFNELALHRTSLANNLMQARASAEIRLIGATKQILDELDAGGIPYAYVNARDGVRHIRWVSEWEQQKSSNPLWLEPGANRPSKWRENPV